MTARYAIDQGDLVISETSIEVWRGRVDDCDVKHVVPLPDGDALVLLNGWCREGRIRPRRNLLRVGHKGSVMWRAEVRGGNYHVYSSLDIVDGIVAAHYDDWLIKLDPATGLILEEIYVK